MPKKDQSIPAKLSLLPKAALAYTAGEDGNPFYSNDATESKFLRPKRILKDMDAKNSDFAVRPGFALSYVAASLSEGKRTMNAYFPASAKLDDIDAMDEAGAKALLKDIRGKNTESGVDGVSKWMNGNGQEFFALVEKLNIGKKGKMTQQDAEAGVAAMVKVFQQEEAQVHMRHMAGLTARLYLMAMWSLETFAVMSNVGVYAETLEPHKAEPKAVKTFAEGPSDLEKLQAAFVASFLLKAKNNKTDKKKRGLGDADDSDDVSSTKAKKGKKASFKAGKKKADKTKKKKKKASSSSSSSPKKSPKKAKKASKKASSPAKKQKSSSSDSSDSS